MHLIVSVPRIGSVKHLRAPQISVTISGCWKGCRHGFYCGCFVPLGAIEIRGCYLAAAIKLRRESSSLLRGEWSLIEGYFELSIKGLEARSVNNLGPEEGGTLFLLFGEEGGKVGPFRSDLPDK
jgi:hypothetical protein